MEHRESLKTLAATLNDARIQANANEATAPQRGVYGQIEEALKDVLALLTDTQTHVDVAYQCLLDGCTVPQALRYVYSV